MLKNQISYPCDVLFGVPHHLLLFSGCPDQRHRHLKQKLEEIENKLDGIVSIDSLVPALKELLENKKFGDRFTEFKFLHVT